MTSLTRSLIVLVLGSLGVAGAAHAAIPDVPASVRAALPGCACALDPEALAEAKRSIALAPTVAEAREQALATPRLAKRAIGTARWLAPGSAGLGQAFERIEDYESRVATAETPEEVAWEFGEFVQLASLSEWGLADVDIDIDDGGCDYSTGELIAIVLGLLLGILPGLILLILLC